ncbi:hypothetical protein MAUB_18830 [Mycolicibacterium aubagnense]|uniref:Uncharacterized protein n=1 Tax=Mycolicibacterium aubagnense TaxID=319707 RepID=A0ABM7IBG7_9MYCO|nr:hypothetical protein MAUB_18830 [Mycolicibacterium aubagnense]
MVDVATRADFGCLFATSTAAATTVSAGFVGFPGFGLPVPVTVAATVFDAAAATDVAVAGLAAVATTAVAAWGSVGDGAVLDAAVFDWVVVDGVGVASDLMVAVGGGVVDVAPPTDVLGAVVVLSGLGGAS